MEMYVLIAIRFYRRGLYAKEKNISIYLVLIHSYFKEKLDQTFKTGLIKLSKLSEILNVWPSLALNLHYMQIAIV